MRIVLLLSIALVVQSSYWAIEFSGEEPSIEDFAQKHGLFHKHHVIEKIHLFHLPSNQKRHNDQIVALDCLIKKKSCPNITSHHNVVWFKEQKPIKLEKRKTYPGLPYTDPLLPKQWHLHNATEQLHVHLNVLNVWAMNITGRGAVIAVIDDGVQHTHPDLKPNWRPGSNNWNYIKDEDDVTPLSPDVDWHGTAVTGLAVAAADGKQCGVGVAPGAKFSAIVLLQETAEPQRLTDAVIAKAIAHEPEVNDIYCNSWGPPDDGLRKEAPHELTARTLRKAIDEGRNGKGSLYMWAAGNGRKNLDNCNYDGYANSRLVTTIGAVSSTGKVTDYSEPCCALIAVLPSGEAGRGLLTTDLMGIGGDNKLPGSLGNCNSNFAGTSVAAPLAAGIAALVLEANPNITWLDFQYILKLSTVKNDPTNPGWKLNGGGNWISHDYGFGLVDAHSAVKIAQQWKAPIREISSSHHSTVNKRFGDLGYVSDTINVNSSFVLHHVEAFVTILHPFRGRLDIRLVSPSGTRSIFAEKHNDPNPNYENWRFVTLFCWGEQSFGSWTLHIQDENLTDSNHNASFVEWTLKLHGVNTATNRSLFVKKGIVEWELHDDEQEDSQMLKTIILGCFIAGIMLTVTIVVSVAIARNLPSMSSTKEAARELQEKLRNCCCSLAVDTKPRLGVVVSSEDEVSFEEQPESEFGQSVEVELEALEL